LTPESVSKENLQALEKENGTSYVFAEFTVSPFAAPFAALAFLAGRGLPVREYQINATPTADLPGCPWPNERDRLFREVESGHVYDLGLHAHLTPKLLPWEHWHGRVFVEPNASFVYLGLPAGSGVALAELLRAADRLAAELAPASFRYGIAYLYPTSDDPLAYAIGDEPSRWYDPRWRLPYVNRPQVQKWRHHFHRNQSYLRGSFRDVYPANLLSEAHVRAALPVGKTLESLGIGRLTLLEPGKWLWEVPNDEVPHAQAVLRQAGLLICA
jgi:hypothetical protein